MILDVRRLELYEIAKAVGILEEWTYGTFFTWIIEYENDVTS